MILPRKECEDILNDTHVEYHLVSKETLDSFKNKERIKLAFTKVDKVKNYEGIYERGEEVSKKQFEFKEV